MGGLAVINLEDDPVILARCSQHVAILHPCCKWERHNMAGTVVLVCGCFDSQFVFERGVVHHWRQESHRFVCTWFCPHPLQCSECSKSSTMVIVLQNEMVCL